MPRKTFKQRIRVNDMKQRHQAHSDLRKRMRVNRKNHNREDAYIQNGRGMEELVQDVAEGSTIASRDTLDPRSLADLLMTRGADGRLSLSSQPLPVNDPKALPEMTKPDDDDEVRKMFEPKNINDSANPNRYKHKGSPYVFWNNLGLHEAIVRALRDMKFTHPTPVQEETLPTVMEKPSNGIVKDNVVSAETGSGKTLVFAIPIIEALMAEMTRCGEEVLTPEGKMPYVKKGGNATAAEPKKSGTTEDKGKKNTKKGGKPSSTDNNKNSNKKSASSNEGVEDKDDDDEPLDEEIDEEDLNQEDLDEEMTEGEEGEEAEEAEELPLEEDDEDEEEIQEEIKKKKTAKGKASKRDRGAESDDDDGEKVKIVKKPFASPEQIAKTVMHTLIISPTRELALQIKLCMEELCRYTMIRIGCVVGGMAPTKQQRVLNKHPHILICTPGRLWELTQKNEGCYLGHSISRRLHYVILDEADKLLQGGRFQDLKAILERVHSDILPSGLTDSSKNKKDHYGDDVQKKENNKKGEEEEDGSDLDGAIEEGEWDEATQSFVPKKTKSLNNTDVITKKNKDSAKQMPYPDPPGKNHRVASFVTSATLSLQTNYTKKDLRGKRQVIRTSNASTMNQVLHELAIKQKHANIFDLAPETGVVSKIHETYLRCPEKAKDLYLYYFLRTYKDKTIIFVNAISMLRRLTKILEILGIPCVGLHAAMQQRQRLKFVDRFKSGDKQVLVATDIASRGLDVQGLRYVIHYQLPRSTDAYIHRCGRTARCGGTGLSLMMVDASEHTAFKKLHESLGRTQSQPMEVFALDPTVVHHLHPHLTVALQIDKLTREISKASANENWLQNMTKSAELDANDMMLDEETKLEHQAKMKAIRILKKRLEQMGKKDTGHRGGKGAFRTGAKAIGMKEAIQKTKERADRQVYKGHKY